MQKKPIQWSENFTLSSVQSKEISVFRIYIYIYICVCVLHLFAFSVTKKSTNTTSTNTVLVSCLNELKNLTFTEEV